MTINQLFVDAFGEPGIGVLQETFHNNVMWGRPEWAQYLPLPIHSSTRDNGNVTTTVLRPGLVLGGPITSSTFPQVKHWDPAATDGSERFYGFLVADSVNVAKAGVAGRRLSGLMVVTGGIQAGKVIMPGTAAPGMSGHAWEHLLRAQAARQFVFDDNPRGNHPGVILGVSAKTANYIVLEVDNGTLFTTTGAGGAVTFTLPAVPKLGLVYHFQNTVDQNMTVAAPSAILVTFNNSAATSVAFSTAGNKIGAGVRAVGDGTKWLIQPSGANTMTVA